MNLFVLFLEQPLTDSLWFWLYTQLGRSGAVANVRRAMEDERLGKRIRGSDKEEEGKVKGAGWFWFFQENETMATGLEEDDGDSRCYGM